MSVELNCTTQQRCFILAFEFVFSVTLILVLRLKFIRENLCAHDHDTHNVMQKSNRVSNLNKLNSVLKIKGKENSEQAKNRVSGDTQLKSLLLYFFFNSAVLVTSTRSIPLLIIFQTISRTGLIKHLNLHEIGAQFAPYH
jgi:hypothetical protein